MDYVLEKINFSNFKQHFESLQIIAYKDLLINDVCLKILGIHFMPYRLDWSVGRHRHSFFEYHYVVENDVYTTINEIEHLTKANQFYLMPPGTFHSHRQNPGTGHIGFALRWGLARVTGVTANLNTFPELEAYTDALWQAPVHPITDENGLILCSMLHLLEMAGQNRHPVELQLALCQLLMNLAAVYVTKAKNSNIDYTFLDNEIVRNALDFIDENYTEAIDGKDIAAAVHMSYSHLSRLFKKYTGKPTRYHLNKTRLSKAQLLLKNSSMSIGAIAREVGFNSEYYFGNLFKEFFGVSPGIYRRNHYELFE